MYLKLALLNLWKYRRRTLVVLVGIVLSVVVMEVVGGMLNGMRETFFSEILGGSGHVQLHADGWENRLDRYSTDYLIGDPDAVVSSVRDYPGTTRVEQILSFGAVVSNGEENLTLFGRGVEPDTEYFTDARGAIVAGAFLPGDTPGLALSRDNARLLELSLGDDVLVLVETTAGSPWYLSYPLTGIYDSGHAELDNNTFFLTHADAESLLYTEGRTNEIRVSLAEADDADAFVEALRSTLGEYDLEAMTWRDIHGSLIVFVELSDLLTAVINAFVVVVAASVITNAILMTAFDRIATFGALRAIGLKRRQLLGMLVTEGALMGIIGSALGLSVGIPIVLYFQRHGLDIGAMSEFFGTGQTYYFAFVPRASARTFVYGVLIATLSALYAGWATARRRLIASLQEG